MSVEGLERFWGRVVRNSRIGSIESPVINGKMRDNGSASELIGELISVRSTYFSVCIVRSHGRLTL